MATYTLISSNVLSSSAASVTFSAIPATYTDLVVKWSARASTLGTGYQNTKITLNGATSGSITSQTWLQNVAGSVSSSRWDTSYPGYYWWEFQTPSAGWTSNTFSSYEVYLPNYAGSTQKVGSVYGASENNATTPYWMIASALKNTTTSAISSIEIAFDTSDNFVSGSSFYLYGISNA
jgi:hypothetical protein